MGLKPTQKEVFEFLHHNNLIEGVDDLDSMAQAQEAWKFLMKQKILTVGVVLKTHKILMLHQNLQPDEKGYFRRCAVYIGGRMGLNYLEISDAIHSWLGDVANSIDIPGKDGNNIKLDHIEYERIHPFVDGNGRTGRIFMNWQRLKAGLPLLIIHEGREQYEYYKWFREDLSGLDTNEV